MTRGSKGEIVLVESITTRYSSHVLHHRTTDPTRFFSAPALRLILEATYARDSYYIVTIETRRKFVLIISKSLAASSDRASNLIRAAYTEPNVDIHSGVDFNFLFSPACPRLAPARKEKRNAIRKPDKGGSANFLQNRRDLGRELRRILS